MSKISEIIAIEDAIAKIGGLKNVEDEVLLQYGKTMLDVCKIAIERRYLYLLAISSDNLIDIVFYISYSRSHLISGLNSNEFYKAKSALLQAYIKSFQ